MLLTILCKIIQQKVEKKVWFVLLIEIDFISDLKIRNIWAYTLSENFRIKKTIKIYDDFFKLFTIIN